MSFSDCSYMRRALELAKKARFNCPPNPAVGCVIVKDRRIIGEGFTQKTGRHMPKSWPCRRGLPRRKRRGRNGLRNARAVFTLRPHTALRPSA